MENEYCDKFLATGAFDSLEIWVWVYLSSSGNSKTVWLLRLATQKKCPFFKLNYEKKSWNIMEKEQDFIFG